MLFFHSKVILTFTLILMTSTISIANQDFGLLSAEWVQSESERLEEDRRVWIEEILETGANPNVTDEDGNTPLMMAVRHALDNEEDSDGWSEIVMALLEAGADPTLPSFKRGFLSNTTSTPLTEAMNRGSDHRITIALIEEILEMGIDPNFTNEDGNTLLMVAVRHALDNEEDSDGWSEIVMVLLEAGADPTLPFKRGFLSNTTTTPLTEAMNRGSDHRITIAMIEARDRLAQVLSSTDDESAHYNGGSSLKSYEPPETSVIRTETGHIVWTSRRGRNGISYYGTINSGSYYNGGSSLKSYEPPRFVFRSKSRSIEWWSRWSTDRNGRRYRYYYAIMD